MFGDINDWKFDRREEADDPSEPNSLGVSLNGLGETSGTFTFDPSKIGSAYTNLVIGLKAGTNYALYFIPKDTYLNNTVFNWSTADFSVGQGNATPELSNFNVFYQVPTPAMLPGLVGIGLAALKKRKEQNEQNDDSTV